MRAAALLAAALLVACAPRTAPPPSADRPQRPFPDLGGQTVMLLPVQSVMPTMAPPASADPAARPLLLSSEDLRTLDAELGFWLQDRVPRVRWVTADAVEYAVERAPTLEVRVRDLPIADFLRGRLERIGDPLYGDLRRVSMVTDARMALLPIGAVWVRELDGNMRVHIAAALIDTFGGIVHWQGIVAGGTGGMGSRVAIASAAQALAEVAR